MFFLNKPKRKTKNNVKSFRSLGINSLFSSNNSIKNVLLILFVINQNYKHFFCLFSWSTRITVKTAKTSAAKTHFTHQFFPFSLNTYNKPIKLFYCYHCCFKVNEQESLQISACHPQRESGAPGRFFPNEPNSAASAAFLRVKRPKSCSC